MFLPLGALALDPPIKPIDTVYVSNESDFEHKYSYKGCWTQDESTVYILNKDVTLSQCLLISVATTTTLDLHGFRLTRDSLNHSN